MSKIIKKASLFTAISLDLVLLCYYLLVFCSQIPVVQTKLAKGLTKALSSNLNTEITIERARIQFFNRLSADGLFIRDQQGDTLLSAYNADVALDVRKLMRRKVIVRSLCLEEANIRLIKHKGDSTYNFAFLINDLDTDSLKDEAPLSYYIDNVEILRSRLSLHDENKESLSNAFDPNHLVLDQFNLELFGATFKDNELHVEGLFVNLIDANGFKIEELSTEINVGPNGVLLRNFLLNTQYSHIQGHISTQTDSFADYADFANKVFVQGRMMPSRVGVEDLSYFLPDLKGNKEIPEISGSIYGQLDNIKGKDVVLTLSDHTKLSLDFELNGLPNLDETFFYLDIRDLRTSKQGLEQIQLPPFDQNKFLDLPENFSQVGQIQYKGKVVGFLNDLVTNGTFSTGIGELRTDLALRKDSLFHYSGFVSSNSFDAGRFFNAEKTLGKISMSAEVKGKGLDKETLEASVKSTINALEFNRHFYRNIKIDGAFKQEQFIGDIRVRHDYLNLDFNGEIDLSGDTSSFVFTANVDSLYPGIVFNTEQFDKHTLVSSDISIDLDYVDLDHLEGQLELKNTRYIDQNHDISLDTFLFISERESELRRIQLSSDIAEFEVNGRFDMLDDFKTAKQIVQSYLPYAVQEEIEIDKDFNFNLLIKDYSLVNAAATRDISIGRGSYVLGSYSSADEDLDIQSNLYDVVYKDIRIDSCDLNIQGNGKTLDFIIDVDRYQLGDKERDREIDVAGTVQNNKFEIDLNSGGIGQFVSDLSFKGAVLGEQAVMFSMSNASFQLAESDWTINKNNLVTIDSGVVQIDSLFAYSNASLIGLDGVISKNPEDKVTLITENFDLSIFDPFLSRARSNISGIIDGNASIRDPFGNLLFESDLHFDSLAFNDRLLGSGYINSQWNKEFKQLEIDGNIGKLDTNTLAIRGLYDTKNDSSPLNFVLELDHIPLNAIEPITMFNMTDFTGSGSGRLFLTGDLKEPLLTGNFTIHESGTNISYLMTHYDFVALDKVGRDINVHFEEDHFYIEPFYLRDEFGHLGYARLDFIHNKFSGFEMKIDVEAEELMVLNTTSKDNELYYGKGFVTGAIDLYIKRGHTDIKLDLISERGTSLFIPLDDENEVAENQFINFVSEDTIELIVDDVKEETPLNVFLDMRMRMDNEATVSLVFDEATGDVARTRGNGELFLLYEPKNGLAMHGDYQIVAGDYQFTIQNIINKRFFIERGSVIKWTGDPYAANINLITVYRTRARLYDILPEISPDVNYKKKIPVDLQLQMNGPMDEPIIGFDVFLPQSGENVRGQLQTELSNENCLNQQVLSLLILNSFTPCEAKEQETTASTNVGKNTAYEAMSNQLSGWLSQISEEVDVGFSYIPDDEEQDYNSEQVEVALSTQLFDDRLIIDGNVGYGNQTGNPQNTKDVVGEFTVEYKIRPDGKLRVKAFNHVNERSYIENDNLYIQGVGLSYQRDYSKLGQLMRDMFGRNEDKKKKKKEEKEQKKQRRKDKANRKNE